jgi:hypothetical protein
MLAPSVEAHDLALLALGTLRFAEKLLLGALFYGHSNCQRKAFDARLLPTV